MSFSELEQLKRFSARNADPDEVRYAVARLTGLQAEFTSSGQEVPKWVGDALREAKHELAEYERAEKERKLAALQARLARKAFLSETSESLEAQINALKAELA